MSGYVQERMLMINEAYQALTNTSVNGEVGTAEMQRPSQATARKVEKLLDAALFCPACPSASGFYCS
jgi:hypothetical protein